MTLGGFVSRLFTMICHVLTTRTTVDDEVAPRRNTIFTFKVPDQNLLTTRRTMDDEDARGLKAVLTFQVLTNTISFIIKYNVLEPAEMTTLDRIQPTSFAAPVQTELPDNERSDPDDHPRDDDNNAVEDEPEVDVSKLTGKQKKLFELRLKMNEARKANQTAMVAEKKRMEAPQESRGISKQKWMVERKKKIGKLLDSNGMDMSKAYMLDTQQMAEAKYKKWEKEPAPGGWDEQVMALEDTWISLVDHEKNVQVQQQVIEVVSHIASTRTKFPMKCVVLCIAGIWERVADIKTCAQAMKCLTTFSEVMGKGFIFEIMSKITKEHKNPKVLSEGLLWMVFAVDDFGVAHLKLKDVFNFCKDTGLQSSAAAATRNATIKLIGVLLKFVGPDIKAFLSDVMPALLSVVEAECEKNPFEGAAATPKKTIKASNSVSSVFGCGLDSLPREDNSRKITPELLKGLECSDWKEARLMFSFAPEAEGFFGDIGQEMVLKNVRDIHGFALAIVLERLNSHGAFPEVHEKTRATGSGPTVKTLQVRKVKTDKDPKSETELGVSAKGSKAVSIMSVQDISGPVGSSLDENILKYIHAKERSREHMALLNWCGLILLAVYYLWFVVLLNAQTVQLQSVEGMKVVSQEFEAISTTEVPSTSTEVPSSNGMEIDNSDLTFRIHPFYVEKGDNNVETKGFGFQAPTTRRNSMRVLRAM
ncbi:protein MOR1 [Tanacetum coccineum]